MNLVGAVRAAEFDAAQPVDRRVRGRRPACGTILLLGTGGRESFGAVARAHGGRLGAPRPNYHPIDDWSLHVGKQVAADLLAAGVDSQIARPGDREPLNFRQLAEMCGLGTVSPVIGHLIHPEYGPWVSLRVALLVDGEPFVGESTGSAAAADFQPCASCARPCVQACPASVYATVGQADHERCARHRLADGCRDGCGVLNACPVGSAHRYTIDEQRFRGAYSMSSIKRWLGLGAWSLVPPSLRRRP